MKKLLILTALISLVSITAFAAGKSETNSAPFSQGRGQYQESISVDSETLSLTGTLRIVDDGHYEIVTKNGSYELIAPYRLSYDTELKDGQEISVEGYIAEGTRIDSNPELENLIVTKAIVNGESIDIVDQPAYGNRGRFSDDDFTPGSGYMGKSRDISGSDFNGYGRGRQSGGRPLAENNSLRNRYNNFETYSE